MTVLKRKYYYGKGDHKATQTRGRDFKEEGCQEVIPRSRALADVSIAANHAAIQIKMTPKHNV